jgi:hypothetical protein
MADAGALSRAQLIAWSAIGTEAMTMVGLLVGIAIVVALLALRRRYARTLPLGRLALFAAGVAAVVGVHCHFVHENRARQRQARHAVELISVEKWTDAISLEEDLVRIRFRFRNATDRPIESFTVHFELLDRDDIRLIQDELSIPTGLGPHRRSSWTVTYWESCPQGFPPTIWERIRLQDIEDFAVEWEPNGLVFTDGEVIR